MWVSPRSSSSSSSMEVDTMRVNNNLANCIDERMDEQSLSPEFSGVYDVFGEPELFPRVGEEFQVEIPSLISESDYSWLLKNSHEAASGLHLFQVGLPIPLIWIKDEVGNNNHDHQKNACKSTGLANKIECNGSTLINRMHEKDHFLVPGSARDTWNEIDEGIFILGLYIFGKNLVQVKRFVGNKNMGDILSFYYGRFYKSDRYRRWSGCRKMRSRKCIFGQKILTGPRQQEILSRLQPNVSEECRNKLLEVSKSFVEGKILLEDYVLTLKALVGRKALVEAVGVGKGKDDLTGFAADSMKSPPAHPVRPEIPVGKACSMLTSAEIISFLTGDFRLSKARTSDLFWEAVWPRLLARGWHSEQPGSYNYAVSSKNSLVFLVPGVKKFSRKLVKGDHYFDSVSDVLAKVASDPELIELETVADNGCTGKEGRENSPDQPRHCYLKVKTPNRSTDVMKFTVVDTSLASEKMKVRELKSLPYGVLRTSTSESNSADDSDTSEEKTNESESVNTMCFDGRKVSRGVSSNLNVLESNPSKEELPKSSISSSGLSAVSKDQKTDFLSNAQRRDDMKCLSLQRLVSDNKIDLVPVTKRRKRLNACSRTKKNINTTNMFLVPRVKKEETSFCPDSSKSRKNITVNFFVAPTVKQENASDHAYNSKCCENVVPPPKIPLQEKNLLSGLSKQESETLAGPVSNSSSIISTEAVPATISSGTKDQPEKPWPRALIDLNLPVAPEVEGDEPFEHEVTDIQLNKTSKESDELSVGTVFKPVDHSEHQPDMHARRQSTRNRPPTTRVLEAFAFGYLDRKEKRRSRDYHQDSSISRPSQRHKVTGSSSGRAEGFGKEEKVNVVCDGNGSSDSNVSCTGFKSIEG